jgi:membrane associated rhomboid family serine protease
MIPEPAEVAVRVVADEARAHDWLVVLQAAGVSCRIDAAADGWNLVVAASDEPRAREALEAYDAEAVQVEGPAEWGPTKVGLVIAAALVAAYPFTGFRGDGRALFMAGEGSAAHILAGQPWRVVTALMLHADATHLVGNVVGMAVLGTAVCRILGPGLGAGLVVLSGAAGNFLNAFLRRGPHVAVGASTAIFGAVGILAGLAVLRARPPRGRGWVPFAAGLALLGLLGTGEHADLAAHFFGFQFGLVFGLATAVQLERPPGMRAQWWLGLVTIVVVAGSWLLADATIPRR